MQKEKALLLQDGNLITAGREVMRVIGQPESHTWCGRPVARITAADPFYRTRIFIHEEIELVGRETAA